ncbi:MAG: phosphoribosylanthranilate isomerase [Actinomycetota bacterium]
MTISDARGIWIKLDGVTRAEDAVAAVDAGASAVGMIFAPSPRRVTVAQAKEIRDAIPNDVAAYGVFDDSAPREVGEVAELLRLDGVQFPAPLVAGRFLPNAVAVLRTVLVRNVEDLTELERLSCDAVHLDAFVEGKLGGTGVQAPWDVIEANRPSVPFVISGGLRPDNVADAIARLRPAGVDVSSGIESEPGIKDADLMRAFVEAARS